MDPFTWLILSTIVSAKMQHTAGATQKIEFEKQAEQEELAAEGRELTRRQRLNKVLSANIVSLSDSGMSGEGTPASIALESAKQASASEGLEGLSDRLKQAQLRRQGVNAKSTGTIQAASTLLTGGEKAARLG
jgi:hypothetical protein